MESSWGTGTAVASASAEEAEVLAYIRNKAMPECPAGGPYTWNEIGKDPECSLGGAAPPCGRGKAKPVIWNVTRVI